MKRQIENKGQAVRCLFVAFLTLLLLLAAAIPVASADSVVSTHGSGAGQTGDPRGLALDPDSGRLYVADRGNARISVFDESGFVMAFGWGVATGANEFQICTTTCLVGKQGTKSGQFSNLWDVAVDEDGNVLASDRANARIQKFSPAGTFILMIGGEVNKTTGADLCTAVSGDVCGIGVSSYTPGSISATNAPTVVEAGPGSSVYVGDVKVINEAASNFEHRVQVFSSAGALEKVIDLGAGGLSQLAVDSLGEFYVGGSGSGITKYSSTGTQIRAYPAQNLGGLDVDRSSNQLFVGGEGGTSLQQTNIAQYLADGTPVRRFGYGAFLGSSNVKGLAADVSHEGVYVSESSISEGFRVLFLDNPPPGPLVFPTPCSANPIGNTEVTLNAKVVPEAKATTVHFDYVIEEQFQENGFTDAVSSPESTSIGSDIELRTVSAQVSVVPEAEYRCRVVASNADGVATGPTGFFESAPPFLVDAIWTTNVDSDSATLNASVNPLEIAATGYFELVDEQTFQETGFADAERIPVGGSLDFGEGGESVAESVQAVGLEPGTRYRYRVRVFDSFVPDGRPSEERSFMTPSGLSEVPDGRRYEMVSPQPRNSAEVGVPGTAGGLFDGDHVRILIASPDGERLTYTSFTSFGDDAQGAPAASQYLSSRTGAGWHTANINPFGFVNNPLRSAYSGFSADLRYGALVTNEPALGDAVEGYENLYLRDNETDELTAITTEEPTVASGVEFCTGFSGLTADGQRLIFAARGAFAGAKNGPQFSLYEWGQGVGLNLTSVLPVGLPASSSESGFGAVGGACSVGSKIRYHALSEDGSRSFWTYQLASSTQLLARLDGSQTVQLDALQSGAGPAGDGRYWGAAANGSKVVFTDANPLTVDANESQPDLYRYDFARPNGQRLVNLTPASLSPGPEPAGVRGVLGISEDASSVYFAANGVLASGASAGNCSGEDANGAGECNLYLWREGEGVRFISRIAGLDDFGWSRSPNLQTARISEDGEHLAFSSILGLTGYDNHIAGDGGCQLTTATVTELVGSPDCAELFIYSASDGELICASCNPTDSRPLGPATLLTWTNPFEHPHQLTEDGNRLFFESLDALDPRDKNGKFDVYEFERQGTGTCKATSSAYSQTNDGCVYLVSTGESPEDSYLIDGSADGQDVFFSTRQRLLPGRDRDERYDIYDFRVDGGFPEIVDPEPCGGLESCRLPAGPPPPALQLGTPGFVGPGNIKHKKSHKKKSKKKKHRKHHRRKKGEKGKRSKGKKGQHSSRRPVLTRPYPAIAFSEVAR